MECDTKVDRIVGSAYDVYAGRVFRYLTSITRDAAAVSAVAKDNHGQDVAADNRPADVPPADAGAPDGAGKPDGAGQPDEPGQPEDPGAPDGAGTPEGVPAHP